MRKFRPTFTVTVTPVEAATVGDTSKGQPYASLRDAKVSRDGQPDIVRTVLAFGEPNSRLASNLEPGVPIRLAVQHDGGSLRLIGLPREDAA